MGKVTRGGRLNDAPENDPFASQDTIVYDKATKTTSVQKATPITGNDPFAIQDGNEKKNETGAVASGAGSVGLSPSGNTSPAPGTSSLDLSNNFQLDDGAIMGTVGGKQIDLRQAGPQNVPENVRKMQAQMLQQRLSNKTITQADAALLGGITGYAPAEVALSVKEPEKFNKYNEISGRINNAEVKLDDLDYLAKNFPAYTKNIIKSIAPDLSGEADLSGPTLSAVADRLNQYQQKKINVQRAEKANQLDVFVKQNLSSLQVNGKPFEATPKNILDDRYMDAAAQSVLSNQQTELAMLERKYPTRYIGAGTGQWIRESPAAYEAEKAAIQEKYGKVGNMLGLARVNDMAKKNPAFTPKELALEYIKYSNPDKYKLIQMSGGSKGIDRDEAAVAINALYGTNNEGVALLANRDEKELDNQFPDKKTHTLYHKLGSELYKKDNWFINHAPTLKEMDAVAAKWSADERQHYEKFIRPVESRILGTNIPMSGLVNKAVEGMVSTATETGKFLGDITGLRSTRDQAQNALEQPYDTQYQDVKGRSTAQEIIDGTGNLTGQVLFQALGTKGLGSVLSIGNSATALRVGQAMSEIGVGRGLSTTIAANAIAFGSSYDAAAREALTLFPDQEDTWKRKLYSNTVAGLNAATERIFKDEKVLDAFTASVAPNVQRLVGQLSTDAISRTAFKSELKNIVEGGLKFLGNTAIENSKESVEELATSIGTSIATAVLAPAKFNEKQAFDDAIHTVTTTFLNGGLVAGVAAAGRNRASHAVIPMLHQLGTSPEFANSVKFEINRQGMAGELTEDEKNTKLRLLNDAIQIGQNEMQQADAKDLSEKARGKYFAQLLHEKELARQAEQSTDPVQQQNVQAEATQSQEARQGILDGTVGVDEDYVTYEIIDEDENEAQQEVGDGDGIVSDAQGATSETQSTSVQENGEAAQIGENPASVAPLVESVAQQRADIAAITDPEERKAAEIKFIMSNLFSNVGEASANKIREYAGRIIAGQSRESVIQGLPQSFVTGIDNLLAVENTTQQPTANSFETVKGEPIGGGTPVDFVKIGNPYIDPVIKSDSGEVTDGLPVSELQDKNLLQQRLNDLISDKSDIDEGDNTDDIDGAIKFYQDAINSAPTPPAQPPTPAPAPAPAAETLPYTETQVTPANIKNIKVGDTLYQPDGKKFTVKKIEGNRIITNEGLTGSVAFLDLATRTPNAAQPKSEENKTVGGRHWRVEFDDTQDASRKSSILRAIADGSKSNKDLSAVLDLVKGLPDESNIAYAVARNPNSSKEVFVRAMANEAMRGNMSYGAISRMYTAKGVEVPDDIKALSAPDLAIDEFVDKDPEYNKAKKDYFDADHELRVLEAKKMKESKSPKPVDKLNEQIGAAQNKKNAAEERRDKLLSDFKDKNSSTLPAPSPGDSRITTTDEAQQTSPSESQAEGSNEILGTGEGLAVVDDSSQAAESGATTELTNNQKTNTNATEIIQPLQNEAVQEQGSEPERQRNDESGLSAETSSGSQSEEGGSVQEEVSKSDKKKYTKKAKTAADNFRKLKTKPPKLKGENGEDITIQQSSLISWNEIIEAGAKAIELSGEIADGIRTSLRLLGEADWFKNLPDADKLVVSEQLENYFLNEVDEGDAATDSAPPVSNIVTDVSSFQTSQGSVYTVNPDGTVSRYKAALERDSYLGEDRGQKPLKEPSDVIFFVKAKSKFQQWFADYSATDSKTDKKVSSLTNWFALRKEGDSWVKVKKSVEISNEDDFVVVRFEKNNGLLPSKGSYSTKELKTFQSQTLLPENKGRGILMQKGEDLNNIPKIGYNAFDYRIDDRGELISVHFGNEVTQIKAATPIAPAPAPAAGVGDGGINEPPPVIPDAAAEPAGAEKVGVTHTETARLAEELGFDAYQKNPQTVAEWEADATKRIAEGGMPALIKKMEAGNEISPIEQVMVAKYVASLKTRINTSPNNDDLRELKRVIQLSDVARSQAARVLRAGQDLVPVEDTLPDYLVREMEVNQVDELTELQKAAVSAELQAIKDANAALEAKIAQLQEENARIAAGEVISRERKRQRKGRKTAEDFKRERDEIRGDIRKKLREAKSSPTATILPYARELFIVAPDVAKLVRNLVEEGVTNLADVVDSIHETLKEEIPEITKKDVRDVIAGEYNPPRKTRNQLAEQLKNLKDEAALQKRLENLLAGEPVTEKEKVARNREITELQNKIKEFRKEQSDAAAAKKNIERLEAELQRVRDRLPKPDAAASTTERRELTDEEKDLQAEIDAEKQTWADELKKTPEEIALQALKTRTENQIAEVERQIAADDFAPPPAPNPIVLDREGQALRDRLMTLRMERELRLLRIEIANRSSAAKIRDQVIRYLNVPRTIMASMDYSAPLRQGIVASFAYPKIAKSAFAEMFSSGFSQTQFDRWFYDLKESPRYEVMKKSKLGITDPHDPRLSVQEEAYMGNIAEKIPLIGKTLRFTVKGNNVKIPGLNLIGGSERAYVMYLNKMRTDIFHRFANRFEEQGKTYENSPELYNAMAGYINNITGRGTMNKTIEKASGVLSTLLFSPRLIASRINLMNPVYYARLPKEVREQAFADISSFLAIGFTIMALTALAAKGLADDDDDITVEADPRSTDFGKIRQGNTRWDIWGGFQPYVRFAAQMATGERKSTTDGVISDIEGKGAFGSNRWEEVLKFGRGKLAPVPGTIVNFLAGKNVVGQEVTVKNQLSQNLTPLLFTTMAESLSQEGPKSVLTVGVPSVFGVGVSSYQSVNKEKKITVYVRGEKRDSTPEEYDRYNKLRIESQDSLLRKFQSGGVYVDKYGDITTSEAKRKKTKRYEELTTEELKKLDGLISKRATYISKKQLGFDEGEDDD